MKTTGVHSISLVSLLLLLSSLAVAEDQKQTSPVTVAGQVAWGKELFLRDWQKSPPALKTADGLGPMYNDVSCVGCHSQGGAGGGGGGPLAKNVDLLNLVHPKPGGRGSPTRTRSLQRIVQQVHPDFDTQTPNVILHRFGRSSAGSLFAYRDWRNKLLGIPDREAFTATTLRRKVKSVLVQLTQRNTPALFGAGVIDSIPDSALIEAAERQRRQNRGISGRVPQATSGAVGRFGWRGQISTLQEFVETACAAELGLAVPKHTQQANPLEKDQDATTNVGFNGGLIDSEPGPPLDLILKASREGFPTEADAIVGRSGPLLDLTQEQCNALTAYVASLPAPEPLRELHLADSEQAFAGEKLFTKIGCADCHQRDLGPAKGIFSDLLLHDMGRRLADPLAALPKLSKAESLSLNGYYGVSTQEILAKATTKIQREWRTPPLWGVRDSAPFLHDGRAKDLETAIRLHEGEAQSAAGAFRALRRRQRDQVLAFLKTLVPPGAKPIDDQLQGGAGIGGSFFSVDE